MKSIILESVSDYLEQIMYESYDKGYTDNKNGVEMFPMYDIDFWKHPEVKKYLYKLIKFRSLEFIVRFADSAYTVGWNDSDEGKDHQFPILGDIDTRRKTPISPDIIKYINDPINKELLVPKFLYHGTSVSFKNSVFKNGIIPRFKRRWGFSRNGVYMSVDPNIAEQWGYSFEIEKSGKVRKNEKDDVLILQIDTSKLNKSKLKTDPEFKDTPGLSFIYYGTILPEWINRYYISKNKNPA